MANVQYAYLEKSKVPGRAAWQAAIADGGFDFELDPALVPFESAGFLPCTLMGAEAGFEIDYDEAAEPPENFGTNASGRDCCISFRWGGSLLECASAMVASYALAKAFDAVVSFEDQEIFEDLERFREQAIGICEMAKSEM